MTDHTTSAGATAPSDGERTLAHDPQHAPAVAPTFTLDDATRLRVALLNVLDLADELGAHVAIYVHQLDSSAAFDVIPDGVASIVERYDGLPPFHMRDLARGAQQIEFLCEPVETKDAA